MKRLNVYRRKIKSIFPLILFSLLICVGVVVICMGLWFLFSSKINVRSPLGKSYGNKNTYSTTTKIQELCSQYQINCTNIAVNNDNTITITIDTDEKAILSLQKDLTIQFASLQLTIGHLTIEGKRFSRLDFRFEKPVISF